MFVSLYGHKIAFKTLVMYWQTQDILIFFPKVIWQTPFAFIILFNILGHLIIHLLNILQVIWQEYIQKWQSFSHSVIEMGFSHSGWVWISLTKCSNSEFKTSATGYIQACNTVASVTQPHETFRILTRVIWGHNYIYRTFRMFSKVLLLLTQYCGSHCSCRV